MVGVGCSCRCSGRVGYRLCFGVEDGDCDSETGPTWLGTRRSGKSPERVRGPIRRHTEVLLWPLSEGFIRRRMLCSAAARRGPVLHYFTAMLHAYYSRFYGCLLQAAGATTLIITPKGSFESRGGLIPLGLLLPLCPLGTRNTLLEPCNVLVQLEEELRDGLCLYHVSSDAALAKLTNSLYRATSPETAARSRAKRSRRTFSSAWPFSSAGASVVISEWLASNGRTWKMRLAQLPHSR